MRALRLALVVCVMLVLPQFAISVVGPIQLPGGPSIDLPGQVPIVQADNSSNQGDISSNKSGEGPHTGASGNGAGGDCHCDRGFDHGNSP